MESESVVVDKFGPDEGSVILKIKCNREGEELYMSVKRASKLKRALMVFCQHFDLEYRSTRFVFDNRVFYQDKSPNQLRMKNFDQIDALIDGNGA